MLDSCHPRLGFGPSARAHSKVPFTAIKMELYRTAESIKKPCYCLHKAHKLSKMWRASHIPNKHSWRLCSGISPCCSETTNKSQRRNNQRENECRESDPDTQSEHRRENVTGNSFTGGWWGGEEVDKAETRGNSDILKWYSTKVIHILSIMWEIQSGSGTFP